MEHVRFWEARVAPGRLDDAERWVRDWLLARSELVGGHTGSEVFLADADETTDQPPRIVLLTRWAEHVDLDAVRDAVASLEGVLPPDGSVERAHGWFFRTAPEPPEPRTSGR